MKKIMSKVMRQVRNEFKKYGADYPKYVWRMEIGSKGGIHIHLIINEIVTDVPMVNALKIVKKFWKLGKVYTTPTYEEGGFQGLAEYLCKEPDASGKEDENARKIMYPYVPSRNLEKPEVQKKVYKRLLVPEEPEQHPERLDCMEGFKVDVSTITRVVSPFNGMTYLKYTELRI